MTVPARKAPVVEIKADDQIRKAAEAMRAAGVKRYTLKKGRIVIEVDERADRRDADDQELFDKAVGA